MNTNLHAVTDVLGHGNPKNHACGHHKPSLYRRTPHGIFATGGELAEW